MKIWLWVAGDRKLEEKGEGESPLGYLAVSIVELDPQHPITWCLDAGRGVKYRIAPFGISEGLYNVLFLWQWGGSGEDGLEAGSVSGAPFKAKSTQQPDPPAYSGDVLWIIFAKTQVLFWAQRSAQLKHSINSMILQVAFARVGAENRSAVWRVLNLPGLLIWFFLQVLSEIGLGIQFALLFESCPGVPETSIQTLPLLCPSCVSLN